LDRAVDLSTAAFVGFLSVSGLMSSYRCPRNSSLNSAENNSNECPISPCSRANVKLAVGAGLVTSSLYLYRGLRY